jgi:DNA polymerase (family X)
VQASPLVRTLRDLSALAGVRGDVDERRLLERATALAEVNAIATEADLGPLVESPSAGHDPALARLRQMYETGGWVVVEAALAALPTDLRWLFESGAVTIAQLAALHETTGATTIVDLGDLIRREGIRLVPGLSEEVERAIAGALPRLRRSVPRVTLGRATSITDEVLRVVRGLGSVEWAEPTGSRRRGQETVGDIEIIAASPAPAEVVGAVLMSVEGARCLHRSAGRVYLRMEEVQLGVRCVSPSSAGSTLLQMTGSRAHVDALFARAQQRGWSLSPLGLDRQDGTQPVGATEAAIYEALDLQWVPAEIRADGDELRAAEAGTLPSLLTARDIRGDLHMHTNYSDGRDSVEAMVQTCIALGYEYLAITDHSPSSAASRSLTPDSLRRQKDDIAALRERYPEITLLHGCEVDILPDARLDFSDQTLELFDIVLASLHDRAGQSPDQLMQRYVAAMRHPLVNAITHPSNRLVPGRDGYELNYDRLFAAAVDTGTVVEIDGAPTHLDLDGSLARRAAAAGVMLVVNSDGHRADALARQMSFGILTARRGWVEPRHVLNTRPLAEVRAIFADKRRRR